MAVSKDWMLNAAEVISRNSLLTTEGVMEVLKYHCPFKPDTAYQVVKEDLTNDQIIQALKNVGIDVECGACMEVAFTGVTQAEHTCKKTEPPLLQCIDCKNTESPAGAMARYFNHGRCLHCGGFFKVVRA